jgi:hypothetical protein
VSEWVSVVVLVAAVKAAMVVDCIAENLNCVSYHMPVRVSIQRAVILCMCASNMSVVRGRR